MTALYDFHLNFEALHKSTEELERLLNKYRYDNKDIEYIYQGLKPLFDKIHNNELKESHKGNIIYGHFMSDSGINDQYPDLGHAYSVFFWDVKGLTDDPYNDELDTRIRKAQQEELARRASLNNKND